MIASATTDITGTASFPTIGGFEGALDAITFLSGVKLVAFPIPVEFTDVLGVAHDSATACSVVFLGTAVANTFTVAINGFLLPGTIDPK